MHLIIASPSVHAKELKKSIILKKIQNCHITIIESFFEMHENRWIRITNIVLRKEKILVTLKPM